MAKRHLEQYDKNGNMLDIYLNEEEVMVGDQTLAEKLADMEDDIDDASQTGGEGTVTGIKVGSNTYEPTEGVVDISGAVPTSTSDLSNDSGFTTKTYVDAAVQEVQTALNNLMNGQSVTDAIDTFNEIVDFLDGIDTDDPTLFNQLKSLSDAITALQNTLSSKANSSDLANYATKSELGGKLSQSDISVETQCDGTVDINVKDDTYTINLNHTHENMAKLVVCEESDLPSTLDPATIYAITDSGETEIEKLIIRGMEFAGGGVPDTGEPMISSPSNGSTINLGTNEGSGVSKTITIKGKNLTGDLTVAVGTGLTISYGQALDASRVTIPMAQALLGAQVTIAYSGSGALDDGSLVISHGGSVLSSVVVVVVLTPEEITAVKFTGSQWLKTDYFPNPDTEFELDCQFVANSHTEETGLIPNGPCPYFISCAHEGNNRFNFQVGSQETDVNTTAYRIACYNNTVSTRCEIMAFNASANHSGMTVRSTLAYRKQVSSMSMTFNNAASTSTVPLKANTMQSELAIGHSYYFDAQFNSFDLIIYRFKIIENGVIVRDYKPVTLDGVPGLYDYVNNNFISSETNVELVPIS